MSEDNNSQNAVPNGDLGSYLGRTVNTRYYAGAERCLIAWPDAGTQDTGESATENMDYQIRYFNELGMTGVVVIYFDRLLGQDRDARQVYAARTDASWAEGIALIGGSLLTRALGAFFMGLNKPSVPTRLFASAEAAAPWIQERLGTDT